MRRLLISIIIIGSCYQSHSQEVNIEWGNEIDPKTTPSKILGKRPDGIYTISNKGKKKYIEKYSTKDMSNLISQEIEFLYIDGSEPEYENAVMVGEKLVLFASVFNKKQSTYSMIVYEIKPNCTFGKSIEISSIEVEKKGKKGSFDAVLSDDKNHILIYHYYDDDKNDRLLFNAKVLDYELEQVAKIEDVIKHQEKANMDFASFHIDNNVNVYAAARISDLSTPNLKSGYVIYQYEKSNSYKRNEYEVSFSPRDKSINTISFTTDNVGDLIIAGYYITIKDKLFSPTEISGTFYLKIDKNTKEVVVENFKDFPNEMLADYLKPKELDKGRKLPSYFVPRQLFLLENGSLIFVSEYFYSSYDREKGVYKIFYGSIFVCVINGDGSVNSMTFIPKEQFYMYQQNSITALLRDNSVYYSYLVSIKNDKLYFLYNDLPENLDKVVRETKTLQQINQSVPVIATIDTETGSLTRKAAFGAVDSDIYIRPLISTELKDKTFIVYGSKGKSDKLGILTIK